MNSLNRMIHPNELGERRDGFALIAKFFLAICLMIFFFGMIGLPMAVQEESEQKTADGSVFANVYPGGFPA